MSLTQAEIDQLLNLGDIPSEEDGQPIPFSKYERIIRGRLNRFEEFFMKYCRVLKQTYYKEQNLQLNLELSQSNVIKYQQYLKGINLPSCFCVVSLNLTHQNNIKVDTTCILRLELDLMYKLIELYLGGTGKLHYRIEGRGFGDMELRLIPKLIELIITPLKKELATHGLTGEISIIKIELFPQSFIVFNNTESCVVNTIAIDNSYFTSHFDWIFAYGVAKELNELFIDPNTVANKSMQKSLVASLNNVLVKPTLLLDSFTMNLGAIANLREGDLLKLDLNEINLTVEKDIISTLTQIKPLIYETKNG